MDLTDLTDSFLCPILDPCFNEQTPESWARTGSSLRWKCWKKVFQCSHRSRKSRSPDCQTGASGNPKIRQSQIWAHRARWAWCARWAPGHVASGGTDYGWSLWWKESWRAHGSHAWSNMKQGVKQKQMNWSSIRNPCMSWYRRLQSSFEKSTNRSHYMVILGNILILCILGIFLAASLMLLTLA